MATTELPARERAINAPAPAAQAADSKRDARALPFIDPADMPDIYALKGEGTCMEPLIADGTLLVGDKREIPQPGDTVIVHFRREIAPRYGMPGWIKRLVHVWPVVGGESLVTLEQLNPRRSYVVPAKHVAAMHKCVGTAISTGDGTAAFRISRKEGR